MRKNSFRVALSLSILLLFLFQIPIADGNTLIQHQKVTFSKEGITVVKNNSELIAILKEIAEVTGLKFIVGENLAKEKVTVSLNNIQLEAAMKRILKDYDFSLLFDSKKKLCQVSVLSKDRDYFSNSTQKKVSYISIDSSSKIGQESDKTESIKEANINSDTLLKYSTVNSDNEMRVFPAGKKTPKDMTINAKGINFPRDMKLYNSSKFRFPDGMMFYKKDQQPVGMSVEKFGDSVPQGM